MLTEGNTAHKLSLTNGPSPTIDVRLDSDRNVGSVLILTPGLDDVQVMLDGKPYKQRKKSKSGQVRINLAVKQHTIRVLKEGFQEEPEQTVDIKKGEEVTLRFQLRANPTVAVLAINGAPPGAQVKVDQRPAGTIETGGSLSVPDISPGNHTIEIAGYKSITKSFKAGETVTVAQSDLVAQVTKVAVKLLVTPANATITYKGPDGRTHETHPPAVELEEGQYTFTAAAPSRSPESIVVAVGPGKANVVTLNLTSPNVRPRRPPSRWKRGPRNPAGSSRTAGMYIAAADWCCTPCSRAPARSYSARGGRAVCSTTGLNGRSDASTIRVITSVLASTRRASIAQR